MTTINQAIRGKRQKKKKRVNVAVLKAAGQNAPFRSGVVERVFTTTPKKPNSAVRKVAMIRISLGKGVVKRVTAYIPDEKHTLQSHATVIVRGGAAKDTPGVSVSVVRGSRDAASWAGRKNSRSKYGVKKPKKSK